MALPVFKVGAEDFTSFVRINKFKWTRNDVDSDKSGRTMDVLMHRKRLGQKRKISFTCRRLSCAELQRLARALNPEYVQITYLDPELGVVTKSFYGTSISATTGIVAGGETYWDDTGFELVER